jgi:hypothetical protein
MRKLWVHHFEDFGPFFFFFWFSSVMGFIRSLFISSLEVMGFINMRERRRGRWKCCEEEEEEERRKKRLGIVRGERRETGILALE